MTTTRPTTTHGSEPMTTETAYVIRDASGEYIRSDGTRTPASDEAAEYSTYAEASAVVTRSTDRVLVRDTEEQ